MEERESANIERIEVGDKLVVTGGSFVQHLLKYISLLVHVPASV